MPSGASPCLGFWLSLDYLGLPWAYPILGSCHSLFHSPSKIYPKLENFTTQNSTGNLLSSVSARKKNNHIRYCNELIIYLYWCCTYYITTSLWFIPPDTSHRCIKNKQTTHKKQNLSKTEQSVEICNFRILLELQKL